MPCVESVVGKRASWHARLDLAFARRGARSVLTRRTHSGPLVVQKPLYPEGDDVCQCIVIHPPGGIVGGDHLELVLDAADNAHAQVTMPGAAKWYGSTGNNASLTLRLSIGAGAAFEWLPQGAIVFDGARVDIDTRIDLARDATFIGWECACLGRTASGERYEHGVWRQRFDIFRGDALLWSERARVHAGSTLATSPAGLNGRPVFGTFVAVGPAFKESLAVCRDVPCRSGEGAVTQLPDVLVARFRGDALEDAHAYFAALWDAIRPQLLGRPAVHPRIWAT
jgi:urease accessory protein